MNKRNRLNAVAEIIRKEDVPNQEQLRLLLGRAGIRVSQSSLSRDLLKLGVTRVRRPDGAFAYEMPAEIPAASSEEDFRAKIAASVVKVTKVAFIVLLFTPPGEAQLVGRLIDRYAPSGYAGGVAGDDTVICIMENLRAASKLEGLVRDIIL